MGVDPTAEPLIVREGTVSMWGYGVSITVSRGHLVLVDGIANERRTLRLSKSERPKRISVVVESGGYVSLDAIRWITSTGTSSLVLLSRDGTVLASIGPRRIDDAKLRRTQALALWSGADLTIARHVLTTKVAGQARVLDWMPHPARPDLDVTPFAPVASRLREAQTGIARATSIDQMLVLESAAAVDYWGAIAPLPVTFATASLDRVPEGWKVFGQRSSPLARGNRRAVTLGNALLNFVYALVESEVTIALAAVGLDPGLGVIHTDDEGRSSFSLDVLEALRPEVDRFVLDTIARRRFSHKDAVELSAGDVRLAPALAMEVARSTTFARAIAFAVSHIVNILERTTLGRNALGRRTLRHALPERRALHAPREGPLRNNSPALTTHQPRIAGPGVPPSDLAQTSLPSIRAVGIRPRRSATLRISVAAKATKIRPGVRHACRLCGVTIARRKPPFVCDECRPEHDAETLANSKLRITTAGRDAIERANRSGNAPHHSEAATAKKRVSAARSARALNAWTEDGTLDGIDFAHDVLPRILDIPVSRIARALDVSRSWAALIRDGRRPTHKRHWAALIALADDEEQTAWQPRFAEPGRPGGERSRRIGG